VHLAMHVPNKHITNYIKSEARGDEIYKKQDSKKSFICKARSGAGSYFIFVLCRIGSCTREFSFFFSEMGEPQPLHQRDAYGKYLY
jgi:hypothetical protein